MKVKNVEEGVKFKTPSGEVFEVIKFIGKSKSFRSDLWLCRSDKSEVVFTDWAIEEKEEVGGSFVVHRKKGKSQRAIKHNRK